MGDGGTKGKGIQKFIGLPFPPTLTVTSTKATATTPCEGWVQVALPLTKAA
jgi:hypothetical protein